MTPNVKKLMPHKRTDIHLTQKKCSEVSIVSVAY